MINRKTMSIIGVRLIAGSSVRSAPLSGIPFVSPVSVSKPSRQPVIPAGDPLTFYRRLRRYTVTFSLIVRPVKITSMSSISSHADSVATVRMSRGDSVTTTPNPLPIGKFEPGLALSRRAENSSVTNSSPPTDSDGRSKTANV